MPKIIFQPLMIANPSKRLMGESNLKSSAVCGRFLLCATYSMPNTILIIQFITQLFILLF